MKQYEEVFFSVVRAALWKTPVVVPAGFNDWSSVLKLAKSQTLTGLVADVLLRDQNIISSLPENIVKGLRNLPLQNIAAHSMLNKVLVRVVTTLKATGIEPVLLKGQGIARNYPVPELRQCGDIDLYVGEVNYEKAYDILKPVVTEIDDREELIKQVKHYHAKVGPVTIEVHKYADVNQSKRLNKIFQNKSQKGLSKDLTSIRFGDVDVVTPEDNFNAVYIFNHLWHHFMTSGIGLRQFCDLACLLHKKAGKLDSEYIREFLDDMELIKPWKALGYVLVNYMGLPENEFPLYDTSMKNKADMMLKRVLLEGNFGKNTPMSRQRTHGYLYEKLYSLKCHLTRFSLLFMMFPKATARQCIYTIISGTKAVFEDMLD